MSKTKDHAKDATRQPILTPAERHKLAEAARATGRAWPLMPPDFPGHIATLQRLSR